MPEVPHFDGLFALSDLYRTPRGRQELDFDQRIAAERTGVRPEQVAYAQEQRAKQRAEAQAKAEEVARREREWRTNQSGRLYRG